MFVREIDKNRWSFLQLTFKESEEDLIMEDEVYIACYCTSCYQYFRNKCQCRVPKVLIQSTGEVI